MIFPIHCFAECLPIGNNVTKPATELKPERTKELEGGFDIGFFKNVVDLSATWYSSKTSDVILVTPIPAGAFHQWRSARNVAPRVQHAHRWSADRRLLDGLLRQALTGWREPATLA